MDEIASLDAESAEGVADHLPRLASKRRASLDALSQRRPFRLALRPNASVGTLIVANRH